MRYDKVDDAVVDVFALEMIEDIMDVIVTEIELVVLMEVEEEELVLDDVADDVLFAYEEVLLDVVKAGHELVFVQVHALIRASGECGPSIC